MSDNVLITLQMSPQMILTEILGPVYFIIHILQVRKWERVGQW